MAEGPEKKPTEVKETPKDKGEGTSGTGKSTQPEYIARLNAVESEILKGRSIPQICEAARAKWGVSEATAYRYVAEVRNRWAEIEKQRAPHRLEEALQSFRFLYEKAVETEDYRLAMHVRKNTAKIEGLDIDRVQVIGGSGGDEKKALSKLSDEELAALEKLQEKTGGDKAPDTDSDGD